MNQVDTNTTLNYILYYNLYLNFKNAILAFTACFHSLGFDKEKKLMKVSKTQKYFDHSEKSYILHILF